MNLFSSIPIRVNGPKVDASWWNTIRTKLIQWAGPVVIGEMAHTNIHDNMTTPVLIPDFKFDSSQISAMKVLIHIMRRDDTQSAYEWYEALVYQNAAGIALQEGEHFGANAGVTLSVDSTGQVSYTSTSFGGANYEGAIRFKSLWSLGIAEYIEPIVD